MTNKDEAEKWIIDAESFLLDAKADWSMKRFRATVQNSQLAIEHASKGIIAYFEEPEWTHNPSRQLERIVNSYKKELSKKMGKKVVEYLNTLVKDTKEVAPWHGISTYGKFERGIRAPASQSIGEEEARNILKKAEVAIEITKLFKSKWC